MKKKITIVLGGLAIAGAAAAITAGTLSYFSDSHSTPGQDVSAGTLKLSIGGNAVTNPIVADNAAPGTSAGSNTLTLTNNGSLPGHLTLSLNELDPGDGKLDHQLIVTAYDAAWVRQLQSAVASSWTPLDLGTVPAGGTVTVHIGTWINQDVGNEIQGDHVKFTFNARLDQIHT